MNKVKIMLTAITVFAVVGGALAFKAKTNQCVFQLSGATCPILSVDYKYDINELPANRVVDATVAPCTAVITTPDCQNDTFATIE